MGRAHAVLRSYTHLMCNLYSVTSKQAAIIAFTGAMHDATGNLPPMPGVFPDYAAPIVPRSNAQLDGKREFEAPAQGATVATSAT